MKKVVNNGKNYKNGLVNIGESLFLTRIKMDKPGPGTSLVKRPVLNASNNRVYRNPKSLVAFLKQQEALWLSVSSITILQSAPIVKG